MDPLKPLKDHACLLARRWALGIAVLELWMWQHPLRDTWRGDQNVPVRLMVLGVSLIALTYAAAMHVTWWGWPKVHRILFWSLIAFDVWLEVRTRERRRETARAHDREAVARAVVDEQERRRRAPQR